MQNQPGEVTSLAFAPCGHPTPSCPGKESLVGMNKKILTATSRFDTSQLSVGAMSWGDIRSERRRSVQQLDGQAGRQDPPGGQAALTKTRLFLTLFRAGTALAPGLAA